jgi:DNA-binding transcriptional regulator YhcF (GntR family)
MSTNEYAVARRINPATAAKAFQHLVDEQILEKRRGVGMFVAPGAKERLMTDRRARFATDVIAPMVAEASRLGLSVDDVVASVRAAASDPPPGRADAPVSPRGAHSR